MLVEMWIADCFDGYVVQMVDNVRHEIRQSGVFGIAPQRVDRIQVGGGGTMPRDRLVGRLSSNA